MPDRYAPDRYDNRDLDALVDEALASYTAAEPDPSLRARIMANAAEARPRPKRLWLLVPAAVCAAAILLRYCCIRRRARLVPCRRPSQRSPASPSHLLRCQPHRGR